MVLMGSSPGSCSFSSKNPPVLSLHTQNRIEIPPPPTPCLQGPTWLGPLKPHLPCPQLDMLQPPSLPSSFLYSLNSCFLSLCCSSFPAMFFLLKSRGLSPHGSQQKAPSQRGLSGPPELPSRALLSRSCFVFFLALSVCGYPFPLPPARNHRLMRAVHGLSCTLYLGWSQLMVSSQ